MSVSDRGGPRGTQGRKDAGPEDSGAASGAVVMVLRPLWARNSGFHENVC